MVRQAALSCLPIELVGGVGYRVSQARRHGAIGVALLGLNSHLFVSDRTGSFHARGAGSRF